MNDNPTELKRFKVLDVFNVRANRITPVRLVKPWEATARDGSPCPGWQLAAVLERDVWWVPDRADTKDLTAGQINGATGPPRPVWGAG